MRMSVSTTVMAGSPASTASACAASPAALTVTPCKVKKSFSSSSNEGSSSTMRIRWGSFVSVMSVSGGLGTPQGAVERQLWAI